MSLFLNLYLGHLLGDFLLQPGKLVLAKRDRLAGLLVHVLVVGLSSAAVVYATLGRDLPAVVGVTAMHAVIERITIVTYLKTPTRGLYTLLLDQAMHALSIALIVWVGGHWQIDARAVTFGVSLPITTLAGIVAVLTVSLFGSILSFETVNAFAPDNDPKGHVLRLDAPRVGGFLERGIALGAALLMTSPAAIAAVLVVPFLPRLVYSFTRTGRDRRRLLMEAASGLSLCVLGFAFVALITYLAANRAVLETVLGTFVTSPAAGA